MKEQSAAGILETTIEKVKNLVNVSTIIGDPMTVDGGITIIPVSKVTYGFASGGSDFPSKNNQELFGGGGGAGISGPVCPGGFGGPEQAHRTQSPPGVPYPEEILCPGQRPG